MSNNNNNQQLIQNGDDTEVSQQQERYLEFVTTVAATKELVEQYLRDRAGDAPSIVESEFRTIKKDDEKASKSEKKDGEELRQAIAEAEKRVALAQQQQEEINRKISAAQQLQAEEAINSLQELRIAG